MFIKVLDIVFVVFIIQHVACRVEPILSEGELYQSLVELNPDSTEFILPPLPYAFNALEPYIDSETMIIHYSRHHQAYTDKLNAALNKAREIQKNIDGNGKTLSTIEDLLGNLEMLPAEVRDNVRNHGGGYFNHAFFWNYIISTKSQGVPSSECQIAIENTFESIENFKKEFNNKAIGLFGSGWVWLSFNNKNGKLQLESRSNQDTPLMEDNTPILGLDVWEHAYYLKYQNKRSDYIVAYWNVVNWQFVSEQYEQAVKRYNAKKDEL